jgi:hypothetical protein
VEAFRLEDVIAQKHSTPDMAIACITRGAAFVGAFRFPARHLFDRRVYDTPALDGISHVSGACGVFENA